MTADQQQRATRPLAVLGLAVAAGWAGLAGPGGVPAGRALAQDPIHRESLDSITLDLAAARARQAALEARMAAEGRALAELRQDLVRVARGIHLEHARLEDLEAGLAVLADQVAEAEADLVRERRRLARLTTGLARLSRQPPDTLLARREGPLETVRSARLLGAAVPALEAEAAVLRETLDLLVDRRAQLVARRDEAADSRDRLNREIGGLSALLRQRERMLATTATERAEEQARMAALADQAADIQALIERLEADRRRLEQARLAAAAAERVRAARAAAEAEATAGTATVAAAPPSPEPAGAGELPRLVAEDPLAGRRPPSDLETGSQPDPDSSPGADPGSVSMPVPERTGAEAGPSVPEPMSDSGSESAPESVADPQVALAPPPEPLRMDGAMLPASGTLLRRFGEPDEFGSPSRGITLRAYPGGPVIAPLDGVVRFAGPFRGYGAILIIEHDGRYHSLIGGLGRIDVVPGQPVVAGEPVGIAALPQNDQNSAPRLYFEFRRDGQPINPIQGLAQAQQRGRG